MVKLGMSYDHVGMGAPTAVMLRQTRKRHCYTCCGCGRPPNHLHVPVSVDVRAYLFALGNIVRAARSHAHCQFKIKMTPIMY